MNTVYEWTLETVDADGDIVNVEFNDKLSSFKSVEEGTELALIRRVGDDINGESEREYAYVVNNKLPAHFDSGRLVPKRFMRELESFVRS